MNPSIFRNIFDNQSILEAIITISETEDELGCFLRLHLVTETFIEAYIASALNIEDIFSRSPSDNIKLQMNYSSKAQLALKLGMPIGAYNSFMLMNKLRNNVAHTINQQIITRDFINNLKNFVNTIGTHSPEEINTHVARFRDEHGNIRLEMMFNATDTPNRINLIILIGAVFTWSGQEAGILYN